MYQELKIDEVHGDDLCITAADHALTEPEQQSENLSYFPYKGWTGTYKRKLRSALPVSMSVLGLQLQRKNRRVE